MKSHDVRNDFLFMRNQQFMVGNFDMPFVYAQDIDINSLSLIGFDKIKSKDSSINKSKTVHFFMDDHKFDEVWKKPEHQLQRLSQYAQLLSPDFSVYVDMPVPLQMYNTFRNRWCASFWQFNKKAVIPTISWGDDTTYGFCFDGIEEGCIVAVSTIGTNDCRDEFLAGFKEMCGIIKPQSVINYGWEMAEMSEYATIVSIPYKHGSSKDID